MHIVSQSSTGELAVLGFLLDPEDVGAPVFDQFMKNVGALNQPEMVQTIKKIDMSSFIDTYVTPMSFMAYGGSLSTSVFLLSRLPTCLLRASLQPPLPAARASTGS